MLILMVELKVCRWRASARGSGERSEPAAGRPRKEQAPKAPSRIASKFKKVAGKNKWHYSCYIVTIIFILLIAALLSEKVLNTVGSGRKSVNCVG